jgi:hypothetical protein
MKAAITVAIAAALLFAAPAPAELLDDGVYQISGLTLKYNDKDERGFNNTGLYIAVSGKHIRLVGAWHGIPVRRDAAIEKTVSDTLFLTDIETPQSRYKFQVRNKTITGRHAIFDEDGSKQVIDSKAAIRLLNRTEADRIKALFNLP